MIIPVSKYMKFWRQLRWRDFAAFSLGALLVAVITGVILLLPYLHKPLAPESSTINVTWIPSTVRHWHSQIEQMAQRYNLDPNFIAIIMTMESGGDPKADSGYAQGLMQITPATAKDIGAHYIKQPMRAYNIWDPATNIEFGTAYLAKLRDLYGSSSQGPTWDSTVELIAAAYNGGFGAANSLEAGKGLHDTQTVVYSRDAFNMWRERRANDSPTFDRWQERGGSALLRQAQMDIK